MKLKYKIPSSEVWYMEPSLSFCFQTSNGGVTENYEEEDIWSYGQS